MALADGARSLHLSSRLRRRTLRKLSAELARLEAAARAARADCQRLEQAPAIEAPDGGPSDGASRSDQVLAAARRREDALRIAIGDCRAEIYKVLVQDEQLEAEATSSNPGRPR